MGETIRQTGNEIVERWHRKMPRFFYWIVVIATCIGMTAYAINTGIPALGGQLHEWWTDIYSYVIGACIGTVCVCKFTVAGGYRKVDPDKIIRAGQAPNMSDVETEQPGGTDE